MVWRTFEVWWCCISFLLGEYPVRLIKRRSSGGNFGDSRLFISSSSLPAKSSSPHFLLPSWGHTSETRKNKVCHKNQKERERTLRQLVSSFVKKRMFGINLGPYFLQNTLICSHPNSKAITCSTWMMGMDKCFWIFVLLLKAVARKKTENLFDCHPSISCKDRTALSWLLNLSSFQEDK